MGGSTLVDTASKEMGQVRTVHALVSLKQHYSSTHLQKLNKTCRGQTIPEAARPLSEQRHQEERIMERDKTVRQGHDE